MSHDVAIVGSGPLGIAAARRLAERGARVLVLEQGAPISDPPGAHFRNSPRFIADPDSYLPKVTRYLEFIDESVSRNNLPGAAITRTLGGQGVIWTNLCPRGDVLWDAMTAEGWSTRYTLAEAYLGVQTDNLDKSVRQRRLTEALSPFAAQTHRAVSDLPVAGVFKDDGTLHYIGPLDILNGCAEGRDRVTVRQDTVQRIVLAGDTVRGLETASGRVEADHYIIAGGAISTPQLLFLSGIRPEALGRYLSYHPLAVCQIVVDPAFCAPEGDEDVDPRLQIRPTIDTPWYTIALRDVSPFDPTGADTHIASGRLVEIQSICPVDTEMHKRAVFHEDGRVTFDVPLSEADLSRMSLAEAEAKTIANQIGRVRDGCASIWMPFGFAHMTGTTRMSKSDDGTGVADYEGRVWGFDNLSLATNGLIPTRMATNPTLTGVSLAIHVADHIQ